MVRAESGSKDQVVVLYPVFWHKINTLQSLMNPSMKHGSLLYSKSLYSTTRCPLIKSEEYNYKIMMFIVAFFISFPRKLQNSLSTDVSWHPFSWSQYHCLKLTERFKQVKRIILTHQRVLQTQDVSGNRQRRRRWKRPRFVADNSALEYSRCTTHNDLRIQLGLWVAAKTQWQVTLRVQYIKEGNHLNILKT